jgi:hypothetical protein
MVTCPSCSADLVPGVTSCRSCGALLSPDAVVTMAPPSGADDGRFPIGANVAGRYTILGLLGRGGMGEVYRAHDVRLDQQVALKFLPETLGRDGAAIARFHNEVRTARQVTHPNVCRVHDIGEAEGVPFISMEFVDGEDLAALLQRIGRLPQDKGVEIAHALCAGLTAAHSRGVLHRDLKPANIMINRAGRAIIMDFGLAGVAAQLRGPEVLAGTPAYMAPEQLQAREVTAQSDIFALGLVLYEIFTGARAFAGLERGPIQPPSLLVKDLSPAIDRLVLACLNDDPRQRPQSAVAVAQALPGTDPLAAAMRAGQAPSPEMVAASRATVRLSARATAACFVAVVALLALVYALMPRFNDLGIAPIEVPPEVLVAKARDIAASAGYSGRPGDYAFGFTRDQGRLEDLAAGHFDWNKLAELRPGIFVWWYRQSPGWLVPRGSNPAVTRDDPPSSPGAVDVLLDPRTRQLLSFRAVPDNRGRAAPAPATEPDWRPLFEAAALDMSRFTPAAAQRPPDAAFDLRRAWTGSAAATPDVNVRIEASALNGKAVSFALEYPWSATASATPSAAMTEARLVGMPALPGFIAIVSILSIAGVLFVRHSYRLGRLDPRGPAVLSACVFSLTLAAWLLRAHLVPAAETMTRLSQAIGTSLFNAAAVFVMYAGTDHYVRRYWPTTLVSWTRLVNGRLRDPLVGQDLLVGTLSGLLASLGVVVYGAIAQALGAQPIASEQLALTLGPLLATYADLGVFALWSGAAGLVGLLLTRMLLRRTWLAALVSSILCGTAWSPTLGPSYPVLAAACFVGCSFVWMSTAARFGLLASAVTTWVFTVSMTAPTTDPSLWYGREALIGAGAVLAIAVYGLRTALAGRTVFRFTRP